MRFGICSAVEDINLIADMGFDYVECGVSRFMSMNEKEFMDRVDLVSKSFIKCEVCNLFFPGDMKVAGPDVDETAVAQYIKKAAKKIALLDVKAVVVGSGRSRNVPEGFDRESALEQFAKVMRNIGDECAAYGIVATVEHLNKGECNIINSVNESYDFINMVAHPNVKLMADFGHMRKESEDMDVLVRYRDLLKHIHIRNSSNLAFPLNRDEDEYLLFLSKLSKAGYDGRISIEGTTSNLEADGRASLKLLRKMSMQVDTAF